MVIKQLNIPALNQSDYIGDNDCTLTSLTSLFKYYTNISDTRLVREIVEEVAREYGYTGAKGTNPVLVKKIMLGVCKSLDLKYSAASVYLKSDYALRTIKNQLDNNNPVLLNVFKANKYASHTVLVVGYESDNILIINDNWSYTPQRLNWNDISLIMSINYLKT